jgi:hypothetical protein
MKLHNQSLELGLCDGEEEAQLQTRNRRDENFIITQLTVQMIPYNFIYRC